MLVCPKLKVRAIQALTLHIKGDQFPDAEGQLKERK